MFNQFQLQSHQNHHRKHSSITSISTNVAGNAGKIERFQAFNQWRFIQADVYHDFIVTGLLVHRGDDKKSFILECTSPGRHWLSKKTLKQFKSFQRDLEKVFPVEAGSTGRPRILPKLPRFFPTRQRQIEEFLSKLLTVSPLIARSRLIGDFLMEDCIEEADEAEVLHGVHISAPLPFGDELKCLSLLLQTHTSTISNFFFVHKWKAIESFHAGMTVPALVSVDDIFDAIKSKNLAKLKNFLEIGLQLGIKELQSIWNVAGTHQMIGNDEFRAVLLKLRLHCLERMEALYRKPWDESVYKNVIGMYLEVAMEEKSVLNKTEKLIAELKMNCPFMSRADRKQVLQMEGDLALLKEASESELISILLAFKTANANPEAFAAKIIAFVQERKTFELAERLEAALPSADCFLALQVDLLNSLTEMALESATLKRTKADFSHFLTKAIQFNTKSMRLRPNVMAYFEFMKLTKLQSPNDFADCVQMCLSEMKSKIGANEDILGKLQVLRLIGNESSLAEAFKAGQELFKGCDFSKWSVMIVEGLMDVAFDVDCERSDLLQKLLEDYESVILPDLHFIKAKLLKLAERLIENRKNLPCAEKYLMLSRLLPVEDDQLRLKTAKMYMKLQKYDLVRQLQQDSTSTEGWQYISLELALINRENEAVSNLLNGRFSLSELFCLFKIAQQYKADEEVRLKLLLKAKEEATDDPINSVAICKAILGLYYDVIVSNGLESYTQDFESILHELLEFDCLSKQDCDFIGSVAWNVGLIHARADDFKAAQIGFHWATKFLKSSQEAQEAKFYFLSAKIICSESEITEADLQMIEECIQTPERKLLRCQLLIQLQKWPQLEAFLDDPDLAFESVAEIILQSSTECPLPIHHKLLKSLAEREQENISKFAQLFRGLVACALLIDDRDTCYFEEACQLIKASFGAYPVEEVAWLCNEAHSQAFKQFTHQRDTKMATKWIELAMTLLYLLPSGNAHRAALTESIQDLYNRL